MTTKIKAVVPAKAPRRHKSLFELATLRRENAAEKIVRNRSKPRTLSEFAARYVSERTLSALYASILTKRAAQYERFHGTKVIQKLFTEDALNAFVAAIDGTGSGWTVNKWRQDLLTLWSSAADDDLCDYPRRRRIRKAKCDAPSVSIYTPDEVRLLVKAAESMVGHVGRDIQRRHYWPAMIRFAWDTGLRRGDCWRFERAWLQADGTFRITQNKTRKSIRRALRPETIAAVDKIGRPQPLAWPYHARGFTYWFQRIVTLVGVDRGTFKWLRRSCGSHVEATNPGAGHRALGNTMQVFSTHYDADVAGEVLLPEAL